MKKNIVRIGYLIILNAFCMISYAQKDIFEIRTYKLKSEDQVAATENYLKNAYMPAFHRMGIRQIGVFKPISNDTSQIKQIIVIVSYNSLEIWRRAKININSDSVYVRTGKTFIEADSSHFPFARVESVILEAFPYQTKIIPTTLMLNPDAVYEMRSYESPTEELHRIKVDMFNAGGEIALFRRLDFQAVFYGDVLSGNHMPNLIYMIVFANAAAKEEHWNAFRDSKEWKKISTDPQYKNNISVSHIDSYLMRRTSYSDL